MASNSSQRSTSPEPASDGTTGVYGITVAAELAGMSVPALRLYERKDCSIPPAPPAALSDTDITRLHATMRMEG